MTDGAFSLHRRRAAARRNWSSGRWPRRAERRAGCCRRSRNASSFRSTTGSGQVSAEVFIKVIEPPHGIDRLKAILRGSRVAHVARITEKLNTAGFAAPPVLLFGREEATGRELLLTPVVNDDGPFRALEGTLAQKRAMLRALGTELARLHRAGFIHGDLTPYNLFIARAPRFTFIDHERTRRTFPIGRRRRQLRNLVQLGRFDLPSLSRTDRMRVLRAYGADLNSIRVAIAQAASYGNASAANKARWSRAGPARHDLTIPGREDNDGRQREHLGGDPGLQ